MKEIKYFDHKNHRPLDLQTDGCNLSEWGKSGSDAAFAWHPKGFPVFLGAEEIAVSDEYAESDPYTVEQGIRSDFHTRRIEVTLDLINEAHAGAAGCLQILDLGCGQGHITDRIRQSNPKAQISGLDYSISAIEYAHDHFGGGLNLRSATPMTAHMPVVFLMSLFATTCGSMCRTLCICWGGFGDRSSRVGILSYPHQAATGFRTWFAF